MKKAVIALLMLMVVQGCGTSNPVATQPSRRIPLASVCWKAGQGTALWPDDPQDAASVMTGLEFPSVAFAWARDFKQLTMADDAIALPNGSGERINIERPSDGDAQFWVYVFFSGGSSIPPLRLVDSITIQPGNAVEFAYHRDQQFPNDEKPHEFNCYGAWIPLGKLPAGDHTLRMVKSGSVEAERKWTIIENGGAASKLASRSDVPFLRVGVVSTRPDAKDEAFDVVLRLSDGKERSRLRVVSGQFGTVSCGSPGERGNVFSAKVNRKVGSADLVLVESFIVLAGERWHLEREVKLDAPPNTQPASQPADAAFQIKCKKPEDRVAATVEDGSEVFTVTSPSGIGEATIERKGDAWPKTVVLRLNLKGLESLKILNGTTELSASVNRRTGGVRLLADGKELAGKGSGTAAMDPLWMSIQSFDATGDTGHYFWMTLPKAMLDEKAKLLTIKWIDYYRK